MLSKELEESVAFERNKEVDEWLLGSGGSDATQVSINGQTKTAVKKISELEKPV